jgi:hypothetical protein
MASIIQALSQDAHNGVKNLCPCCFESVLNGRPIRRMTVYGRSEGRLVHCECYRKYMEVDNTGVFNSSKIRKNGITNRAKLSISIEGKTKPEVDDLKAYMISCGYTYTNQNPQSVTFLSPMFSGCSSVSKLLKVAPNKIEGFRVVGFRISNVNDGNMKNITMRNASNKEYTEAIRLFNKGKFEKLDAFIKEYNN